MSREQFYGKLELFLQERKGKNIRLYDDEEHAEIISFLTNFENGENKPTEAKHRRWLKSLVVEDYGGVKKLVRKDTRLEVVKKSDVYDRIHAVHLSSGHTGRDKLLHDLSSKFFNVGYRLVSMYLATCMACDEKRKRPRKSVVVKPIVSEDLNSRAQVDLVCFESEKDGDFKYILTYQDHLSKFVSLRALKTKRAQEVAYHLIEIFCVFGAPCVLQSDNGREFTSSVITECVAMWPDLKLVHGKPRHSQSQVGDGSSLHCPISQLPMCAMS